MKEYDNHDQDLYNFIVFMVSFVCCIYMIFLIAELCFTEDSQDLVEESNDEQRIGRVTPVSSDVH